MNHLNRKDFLRGLGAGALLLGAGRAVAAPETTAAALPTWTKTNSGTFWTAVRASFPVTKSRVYFNTGGLGPASTPVLDVLARITKQLQTEVETGHGLLEEARKVTAEFLRAGVDEVCFTRNATEGNSIVAAGLTLQPGDEVIFETHAHPGGSFPWLNRQRADGIKVKLFEPDPTSAEGNVERIRALLSPRTRVIQVSHITAPTGIIMPVAAIAQLAREKAIWFHVDGAQSAGMVPINLGQMGCDSYATSGHKWLGAPHETGILFVRKANLDRVRPMHIGAYSADESDPRANSFHYVDSAQRYEYGTRNAAAISAVAEAMRWQNKIGRERIAARGRELADRVRAGFAPIKGLEVLTPAPENLRGSIITFRSERVPFEKLFGRLLSEYHLRCRPVSEVGIDAIRVSTHVFNDEDDCDRLITAMTKISAG